MEVKKSLKRRGYERCERRLGGMIDVVMVSASRGGGEGDTRNQGNGAKR